MEYKITSKEATEEKYVYEYSVDILDAGEVICSFSSICRKAELEEACELMISSCEEEKSREGQPK